MRKIDLVEPQTRIWKRWRRDCDVALAGLKGNFTAGRSLDFDSAIYGRKSIKRSYFFAKMAPFYGKCAYCEAPITDFQHPDVEHFRPKGALTDEKDVPIAWRDAHGQIELGADGNPKPHPGYWWLAYEWRNLLPSCGICNQPSSHAGSLGKRNRFPVAGQHARDVAEVATEAPLLIDPTLEDPGQHLKVRLDRQFCGALEALDAKGAMTLQILGLNARDQLIDSRKTAIEAAFYLAGQLLTPDPNRSAADAALLRERVAEIRAGKNPFSMAQLAVLRAAGILDYLQQLESAS